VVATPVDALIAGVLVTQRLYFLLSLAICALVFVLARLLSFYLVDRKTKAELTPGLVAIAKLAQAEDGELVFDDQFFDDRLYRMREAMWDLSREVIHNCRPSRLKGSIKASYPSCYSNKAGMKVSAESETRNDVVCGVTQQQYKLAAACILDAEEGRNTLTLLRFQHKNLYNRAYWHRCGVVFMPYVAPCYWSL
jgi:hypothetical protein